MAHNWKRILLDGDWKLFYQKNSEYVSDEKHPDTVEEICSRNGYIPAVVPGNLELDLEKNGIIPSPFWGQNVLQMQSLESVHMFYGRKFEYHRSQNVTPYLIFEGLDTVAEIFLNGISIGCCENMLIPQVFLLCDLKEGINDLVVHITPACIAARGRKIQALNNAMKYEYESLRLRKSASMFGWDIMPRIVSGGIWRPVYIEEAPSEHLKQVYLMTTDVNVERKCADLSLFFETQINGDDLSEYRIGLNGRCENSIFHTEDRLWYTAGKLYVHLENALFWWPKGYGKQYLYEIEVILSKNGQIIDTWRTRTGIRTVELERTDLTDSFLNGKFQFSVNNKKIFILGTNFVPVDALHSRDRERLPRITELLKDIGCNTIRCWGGSVYEDDYLYDFCDEEGILIWQDFMMACGTYPVDEQFCQCIREEGEVIVRRLRQHPSLLIWSGDNECDMSAFRKRPSGNRITREVLPEVIEFEDPVRPFLPSSPYIAKKAEGKPEEYLPENHLWGPRDYYKSDYYIHSFCNFASEIGYHGCPSRDSIVKFIPAEKTWPWQNNDDWMVHASAMETGMSGNFNYRIELMAKQIKELFGEEPDNLDDFILASQISQAEAKKFFIELFRTGQPKRTGIIWWNLIDGWPQFSDAVVDYYFEKKLAYYYIRQVQQPILLSIKEPLNWNLELVAVNDSQDTIELEYFVRELTENKMICEGEIILKTGVTSLSHIPYSQGEKKIYMMSWKYEGGEGKNHYLAGNPPFSLEQYRDILLRVYKNEEEV